ncbi:MAG TPA: hypothetical protein P5555_07375 [Candidatus Paceibacterota bacterium]|nr:hypothetical protein [Verrucomicrobiota bacterium]HRZ44997.1 hypothetical protein [Candidatus Paceibacterota bacterium]
MELNAVDLGLADDCLPDRAKVLVKAQDLGIADKKRGAAQVKAQADGAPIIANHAAQGPEPNDPLAGVFSEMKDGLSGSQAMG